MPTMMKPPAGSNGQDKKPPAALIPFTRASREHVSQVFVDQSVVLGATSVQFGPFDVPAYGFMRFVRLEVTGLGGVGGGNTVDGQLDAPWNVLQDIQLTDVNGSPIAGTWDGYTLYLINKYGGLSLGGGLSPRLKPSYQSLVEGAGASGDFGFALRLPVELGVRDAMGALIDQNATATYKLSFSIAASSTVYATAPATTLPTVRVRAVLEAWAQPAPMDQLGSAQATTPPAINTTGYWTSTRATIPGAGEQTIRLPRVGNYIRNLIFVARDNAGSRIVGDASFPVSAVLNYDTQPLNRLGKQHWRGYMAERYGFAGPKEIAGGLGNSATDFRVTTTPAPSGIYITGGAAAQAYIESLDAGVYVYDFIHDFDGRAGAELRDLWLPTVQSTSLDLQGNWTGAGTLTVITNDVSPAGNVFV